MLTTAAPVIETEAPPRVAIFGTAGRDRSQRLNLTRDLWDRMLDNARELVPAGAHLISGGAAWADHLAVHLFLERHGSALLLQSALTLHLPAPMNEDRYVGGMGTAGSACRYYHERFSDVIGEDTQAQIGTALMLSGANYTFEPVSSLKAFFARNQRIAQSLEDPLNPDAPRQAFCWTFGADKPVDGGSADTWRHCARVLHCTRTHINLGAL